MSEAILHLKSVSKSFGGIRAVDNVSMSLNQGEVVGLIGPNGAGKTTLVNVITGAHRADAGQIWYKGEDVTRQRPWQAARRGLCRTFQVVQPFPEMTVLENVTAGALFGGGFDNIAEARDVAREHLEFVDLNKSADLPASALTLASRKRLELAKSLAMTPSVLMLDEVNAGLNSVEIDRALDLIRRISERGIIILIIEHLMKVVLSVSQRILVLHHGALIAEGPPDVVTSDERVIEAYLGTKYARRLKDLNNA
jgi:branched-chain amino acid transport system ATP-binding protein